MNENRCLSCLELKANAGPCPICGVDDRNLPVASNTLPAGTILAGHYLVGRLLGAGGFGNTYLALDLNLQSKLAIKEFLPKDLASRERNSEEVIAYTTGESQEQFALGIEKFLDEARVLARFKSHPNIVSVNDFFKQHNTAYIVMDYLEGITFKEYLKRKGGKLSFDETMKIMTPVMDALREVHAVGMLHRDISPDNIYITRTGLVKVLDFGAARQAMGEVSKSLSVILKPGYAPSEQYFSKGKQGPWTDVYAVAATIYHAVTGVLPPESMERMDEDTMQSPSQLGAVLPAEAEAALLKALAIRGAERWQTIGEMQLALSSELNNNQVNLEESGLRSVSPSEGTNAIHAAQPVTSASRPTNEVGESRFSLSRVIWTSLIVIGIVVVAINIMVSSNEQVDMESTPEQESELAPVTYVLADYKGKPLETAKQELTDLGLDSSQITSTEEYNKQVTKGTVISQEPVAGSMFGVQDSVTLTVSEGPDPEEFEDHIYLGKSIAEVKQALGSEPDLSDFYNGGKFYAFKDSYYFVDDNDSVTTAGLKKKDISIFGAYIGMTFSEIKQALGQDPSEGPGYNEMDGYAYVMYEINGYRLEFAAQNASGKSYNCEVSLIP